MSFRMANLTQFDICRNVRIKLIFFSTKTLSDRRTWSLGCKSPETRSSDFLHFGKLFYFGLVLSFLPSKERSREMGLDILDQCRGEKYVNSCTASSCKQSQLRTFQNFYYIKKKLKQLHQQRIQEKKDLNTYLRPVSLSNSIQYAKTIGPNNRISCTSNAPSISLIRIPYKSISSWYRG